MAKLLLTNISDDAAFRARHKMVCFILFTRGLACLLAAAVFSILVYKNF